MEIRITSGKNALFIFFVLFYSLRPTTSKWVEGHLKTSQNWAFLARFCFLSFDGQFEYHIEFNREIGLPNLLLYYDDKSQWPSVYHSNKTCQQREAVLNKGGQNQIIPLSHWYPETEFSGCVMKTVDANPSKTHATQKPAKKNKDKPEDSKKNSTQKSKTPLDPNAPTQDPRYFNQFLKTTSIYETNYSSTETTDSSYGMELMETESVTESLLSKIDNDSVAINGNVDFGNGDDVEIMEGFEEIETVTSAMRSDGGNANESDMMIILRDVETLFDNSDQRTHSTIKRRRRQLSNRDFGRPKKFNDSPPRPSGVEPPSQESGLNLKLVVSCHNARRFRSARERWWFVAISNCGENKGLDVKYKFLMTNGPPGDYWHEHFSADEFYVLPILMAFCFAYVLMIIALVMCSVELKTRQMLHTTYKLFVFSVALQQTGILLQSLAYTKYAVNGVGAGNSKVMGQLLCGISEITYLLLLVLMAKGYTITRARLKVGFTVKLTVFICAYFITYTSLFIYQAQMFDPGEVLYLYESPAGYGLIVLRICAWFMFGYAIIFTIKKYPEKGVFYYPFSLCGTFWFYAGPFFILSANNYIDKWVRESVVIAVLLFITFCGHISFLLLTLPVFANKNFPYHVRTTQIGVMEVVGMVAGNSTVDHFSHNIYNPNNSHILGIPQTVMIPLTRRTEELFGGVNQYLATAPPLHANNSFQTNAPYSNGTAISYISGNMTDTLSVNNIGPKLSISTQHSTESATIDRLQKETDGVDDNQSDSLENRFVPSENVQNGHVPEVKDSLKVEDASQNNDSIFIIDHNQIENESPSKDAYTYKDDPNYIRDINNPFLVGASFKARKGLLEPIVRKDAYNPPPPKWSLAKSSTAKSVSNDKSRKDMENTVKKLGTDYHLQGVIGTFPLPQIPRSTEKTIFRPEEDSNRQNDSLTSDRSSLNEESLQIMQASEDIVDKTVLALFAEKKEEL